MHKTSIPSVKYTPLAIFQFLCLFTHTRVHTNTLGLMHFHSVLTIIYLKYASESEFLQQNHYCVKQLLNWAGQVWSLSITPNTVGGLCCLGSAGTYLQQVNTNTHTHTHTHRDTHTHTHTHTQRERDHSRHLHFTHHPVSHSKVSASEGSEIQRVRSRLHMENGMMHYVFKQMWIRIAWEVLKGSNSPFHQC